jgi:uncharacterized protein YacL
MCYDKVTKILHFQKHNKGKRRIIMFKKITKIVLTILGVSAGYGIGILLLSIDGIGRLFNYTIGDNVFNFVFSSVTAAVFGLILYLASPWIIYLALKLAKGAEDELEKVPTHQIIIGSLGLIFGLVIAFLISSAISLIPIPYISLLSLLIYVFLGYLGVRLAIKNIGDFSKIQELFKRNSSKASAKEVSGAKPKILDTSVIIDGRIADICQTGFVEGTLIIPNFVLEELRHIADSSDGLKRNRGRRGLDILNLIQKELKLDIRIVDTDFEDVSEVDMKLLKLAKKMNGMVVTNDFNLNKVAELQGVTVLNINELANAVKPVVLPGEEMTVHVVKEGKESNQGVAYLDDGTMIVVEGGRKCMNETIEVLVTSVLQTAAGRMIFAKPAH